MKKFTYVQALVWIVGSLLIVPGAFTKMVRMFWTPAHHIDYLCRVVQTGPQKEALKTSYLAEIIQLSADRPVVARRFDAIFAQQRLRSSPVIKQAYVKVIKPDTVYIDYTVRQPIAALFDFENVALDEDGVPFPIAPFFSPKKLPEIILGVKTFAWNTPLKDQKVASALHLLKMMLDQSLNVLRIDMTASTASSLGKREIVVIVEESGFSKFLRLTPKNLTQELGNYLELRKTLPAETQVIDLRIPQLAFIESPKGKK